MVSRHYSSAQCLIHGFSEYCAMYYLVNLPIGSFRVPLTQALDLIWNTASSFGAPKNWKMPPAEFVKTVRGWSTCPMRRSWQRWTCSAWRWSGFGGDLTSACSAYEEVTNKMDPRSSQPCMAQEQETIAMNWNWEVITQHKEEKLL